MEAPIERLGPYDGTPALAVTPPYRILWFLLVLAPTRHPTGSRRRPLTSRVKPAASGLAVDTAETRGLHRLSELGVVVAPP
jgi:hypothetical protein